MISVVTQCKLVAQQAHSQPFVIVQTVQLHIVLLPISPVFLVKIAVLALHFVMFADSTSHD